MMKNRTAQPQVQKPSKAYRKRAEDSVPLGISWKKERSALIAGLITSILISLVFPIRFINCYHALFFTAGSTKTILPGAQMPDFKVLMDYTLTGFLILALSMIPLALYHYRYHTQNSKSIYLMKRLPSKYELAKRCLTMPCVGLAASAITACLLICLFYLLYVTLTPAACMTPEQWKNFWFM